MNLNTMSCTVYEHLSKLKIIVYKQFNAERSKIPGNSSGNFPGNSRTGIPGGLALAVIITN